jgi:nucleoside-diphosphate-sugar epimerase
MQRDDQTKVDDDLPSLGGTAAAIADAVRPCGRRRTRPALGGAFRLAYTGGDRGWVGDVPRFRFSTERLSRLGWKPRLGSDEAVLRAIDEIAGKGLS